MCSHNHWRRMIGAIRLIGVAAGVVIAQHDAGAAEAAAIAEVSCVFPRWSPDGTRITFVRDGGRWDKKQVWVIGADGTEPMRVAEDFLRATHPTWSPDGEMIAFAGSRGNEQMQIWLADARDGHVLRQLTYSPPRKMFPCFSPDGEHLIYFTWSGVGIVSQEGADDYLLIRTDWPEEPRNAALVAPRFSPDGEWIAFAPAVPWPEQRVSVARADGSDIAEVENTQRACESLTWTPDGRLVVLCCGRTAEELRICAEPGAPIPKARLLRELRGAHSADWSPDGKSLVVSRGGRLYTVDVMRWDERLIGGLPDGGAPPTVNRSAEQRWLPIAKAAEAAGDYARATAVYRTMLAANDIAVLPRLVAACTVGKRALQVLPELLKAYREAPNYACQRAELGLALAAVYDDLDEAENAKHCLQQYRQLAREKYPGLQAEVVNKIAEGFEEADRDVRRLLLVAALYTGASYVSRPAIPLLEHAVAIDPDCAAAHFMLASAYRQTGDLDLSRVHEARYGELVTRAENGREAPPEVGADAELLVRQCERRLHVLGRGLAMYRADWNKWPQKLRDLQAYLGAGADTYYCPMDDERVGDSSYEYTPPRADAVGPVVVLRCPHHGAITLVLMSDGTVARRSTAEVDDAQEDRPGKRPNGHP